MDAARSPRPRPSPSQPFRAALTWLCHRWRSQPTHTEPTPAGATTPLPQSCIPPLSEPRKPWASFLPGRDALSSAPHRVPPAPRLFPRGPAPSLAPPLSAQVLCRCILSPGPRRILSPSSGATSRVSSSLLPDPPPWTRSCSTLSWSRVGVAKLRTPLSVSGHGLPCHCRHSWNEETGEWVHLSAGNPKILGPSRRRSPHGHRPFLKRWE